LGFLPFLVLQLGDNLLLTGNPLRYPYALFGGDYNSLGFGPTKGVPTYGLIGHSPLKGFINLLYNLLALSLHLFGWPAFSLFLVLFSLFHPIKNRSDYLSLSIIISFAIYYFFYWYNGISPMGPRYYYEAIPFFVFLTMRGLPPFLSLLNRWGKGFPSFSPERFVASLIVGLFFIDIFFYIPGVYRFFKESTWGCSPIIARKVKEEGLHNALVIVLDSPEGDYKQEVRNMFNYSSAFIYNSPTLSSDIVYAKDLGDQANEALFRLFPERKFYLFEYQEDLPFLHPYPIGRKPYF